MYQPESCDRCQALIYYPDECVAGVWKAGQFVTAFDETAAVYCLECAPRINKEDDNAQVS
jgi:hypothetical protein